MNTTDIEAWLGRERQQAWEQNNELLITAFRLHDGIWLLHHADQIERLVADLQQAQTLAEQAGNPCLALYFQLRTAETYAIDLENYRTALDIVVRLVVEVRKYPTCPALSSIYRTAILVQRQIDPLGYYERLTEMLDYVEAEIALDYSDRCLLMYDRAALFYDVYDYPAAFETLLRYVDLCQQHPKLYQRNYMSAGALGGLCDAYYLQDNLVQLEATAHEAEALARRSHHTVGIARALFWRAYCAYRRGEKAQGDELFGGGEALRASTTQLVRPFFSVVSLLYWQRGEYDLIPPLMTEAVAIFERSGTTYNECITRLLYCGMLGLIGQPLDTALAETRTAAARLLKPDAFLAKVERVAQGDYDVRFF